LRTRREGQLGIHSFQDPLRRPLDPLAIILYSLKYKKIDAVAALAALAQDNRLDVFRLLVQAGPEGMPAGEIARALKLAPSVLTFHFDRLRVAGLVTAHRDGRSIIYAAKFETMNALLGFLTENCCKGAPETWVTAPCRPARSKRTQTPVS
jgi:ArsR family transcriptional regulator, arsenate/arsenite/antimonite-responsive transcriptional repressor